MIIVINTKERLLISTIKLKGSLNLGTRIIVKINTAYCYKFLKNTSRNFIWNSTDYILYYNNYTTIIIIQ